MVKRAHLCRTFPILRRKSFTHTNREELRFKHYDTLKRHQCCNYNTSLIKTGCGCDDLSSTTMTFIFSAFELIAAWGTPPFSRDLLSLEVTRRQGPCRSRKGGLSGCREFLLPAPSRIVGRRLRRRVPYLLDHRDQRRKVVLGEKRMTIRRRPGSPLPCLV